MLKVVEDKIKTPKTATAGSGSGGDDFSTLEKRVDRLEGKFDKMQESINRIELILVEIKGDLKTKASAVEVAEIKGRISQIPNYWQQMAISLTIVGFAFAILKFVK